MKHRLEQYYCGDSAWGDFVEAYSSHWDTCQFKEELGDTLHGHFDIAKVVYGIMRDSSLSWIGLAIPALDGLSAADCTATPNLTQRLKSMLMRMP